MPGGALTANTQMMRDNNCMHLYNDVIKAMREVVERGGYGTSVTPVSQFYFQQAFANVTQGAWKKMTDGYGKMILGYFGHTPSEPDPELVKLASEQLELEPTKEDVVDINDRNPELGIKPAQAKLKAEGLEETEENIFIVATCGDKGIAYLKGNAPLGVRYKEDVTKAAAPAPAAPAKPAAGTGAVENYAVTVNGQTYNVQVAPGTAGAAPQIQNVQPAANPGPVAAAPAAAAPAAASTGEPVRAPMPGTVTQVIVSHGENVAQGETLFVIEAMKMEVEIKAPKAGSVVSIEVSEGDTITAEQVMAFVG
jgi:pyruvate carboxylase subunit B